MHDDADSVYYFVTNPSQPLFFLVIVDHTAEAFEVHGPLTDDIYISAAVVELQEAGLHITCQSRPRRCAGETKAAVVEEVGRELDLEHRTGLLRRLRTGL